MVSFWCPHVVPAKDFRMLRRDEALRRMLLIWGPKEKWVSKVTPRILGFLLRGRGRLLIAMDGIKLDWWKSGVKRVIEDFEGSMVRPLEDAQSEMEERWSFRVTSDWGMDGEEVKVEKSSA